MKRIHRLLQEPEGHRGSAAPVFVVGLLVVSLGVAIASWQTTPSRAPKPAPSQAPLAQAIAPVVAQTDVSSQHEKPPYQLLAQAKPMQDQTTTTSPQIERVAGQLSEFERIRNEEKLRNELETPYRKWMNEDVAYIIADEERAAFKKLQDKEEQEHFIEQFWLRRDPTPGTPENEYRDEHYRRIAYANERYTTNQGLPGWKTDRGRIYIVYGPPDEINSHPSGGAYQRPPEQGGGTTTTVPFEQWRYRYIEGVGNDVMIEFVDPTMTGEYRMTSDPAEKAALLTLPRSVTDPAAVNNIAPVKTGATAQVMGATATGGRMVLLSIPLNAYGDHNVNLMGTISSSTRRTSLSRVTGAQISSVTQRPVQAFEQMIPGPAPLYTRIVPLAPGSYRLNIVLKDLATGGVAHDEIDFEVK